MSRAPETVSGRRWLMISLAFWATAINYLDRQTLSVAAPVLRDQFHMSNTEYARVLFAFMLAYTIMNGISGPLIDRLGTRLGYGLCIAWWGGGVSAYVRPRGDEPGSAEWSASSTTRRVRENCSS